MYVNYHFYRSQCQLKAVACHCIMVIFWWQRGTTQNVPIFIEQSKSHTASTVQWHDTTRLIFHFISSRHGRGRCASLLKRKLVWITDTRTCCLTDHIEASISFQFSPQFPVKCYSFELRHFSVKRYAVSLLADSTILWRHCQ
jgi:hypothetical protein